MKFAKYLAIAALAVSFASCSNEEPANPTPNNEGNQFMAISLEMVGNGTRATTDGGFIAGTDDESSVKVDKSIFLFYDANGNFLTSGTIVAEEAEGGYLKVTSSTGSVEKKSNAMIILGPTKIKPAKVLAVLNYNDCESLKDKSLAQVQSVVVSEAIDAQKGNFTMTNSAYIDANGNVVDATAIDANKIKETSAEAVNDPVDIYVERTWAKLTIAYDAAVKTDANGKHYFELTPEQENVYVNGSQVKVRVVIDGVKENAVNQSGYLVKDLESAWNATAPFTGWNDASNFRSYWEKDANYDGAAAYDFNGAAQKDTYAGLKYYTWKDAADATASAIYLYPNTVAPGAQKINANDATNATSLLIAAHIEYSADNGTTWQQTDLVRKDGVFYTLQTLEAKILESAGLGDVSAYRWSDGQGNYTALNATDFTWSFTAAVRDNKSVVVPEITGVAAGKDIANLQQVNGGVATTLSLSALNAQMLKSTYTQELTGWSNGACFYQVPIEHLTSTDDAPFAGFVRNHVYALTIQSITRLGGALWNDGTDQDKKPGEEIPVIPGKETNYYVGARINILAWKGVNQTVVIK